MDNPIPKKKYFTVSNIISGILVVFTLSILVFPEFKAKVLQVFMSAGLFQPGVPGEVKADKATAVSDWKIRLNNSEGEVVDGHTMDGKVVFINFWATWCPPCIAEMPSINTLYKNYKNNSGILFLLVDADGNLAKSGAFMKDRNFELPVYAPQGPFPEEWFGGSLPTTLVLDKQGRPVYHHEGIADYGSQKFKDFLDGLLRE